MPAVVVAPEPEAAAVGEQILRDGGNAVDAAIATAFAQAVVNPLLCGLGGSALVLHADLRTGVVTAIDGEAAIGSAPVPETWSDEFGGRAETFGRYAIRSEDNQIGASSAMVPGFVDAMDDLASLAGSGRANAELLAGATRLARHGFEVSPYVAQFWSENSAGDSHAERPGYPSLTSKMRRQPETATRYLHSDGAGFAAGETFAQPWIADVLDRLAAAGLRDFLHGEIGGALAAGLERDGSLIRSRDVGDYDARRTAAVTHRLEAYVLHTTPPPSPGIQVAQMLAIARGLGLNGAELDAAMIDSLAKVMRASFADNRYVKATKPEKAGRVAADILAPDAVTAWVSRIAGGDEVTVSGMAPGDGTTHVTAVDDHHAVCITHSLGSVAGSAYVVPEVGVLLNNFLGHYDPRPGRDDSIRAGARIGTGAPLIVMDKRGLRLASGAPGGSRLITSGFQVGRNVLFAGDEADAAVARARVHSEEGRRVFVEPATPEPVAAELTLAGNEVVRSTYMSRVQAVSRDVSGKLVAGADPRGGAGIGRVP